MIYEDCRPCTHEAVSVIVPRQTDSLCIYSLFLISHSVNFAAYINVKTGKQTDISTKRHHIIMLGGIYSEIFLFIFIELRN